MSDNVQVVIKVRPLIQREKDQKFPIEWTIKDNTIIQENGPNKYQFDHVFDMTKKNQDIFDSTIQPTITASMNGVNGTIFAYGQTSSGKTHTMTGSKMDTGIISLTINYMFNFIKNDPTRIYVIKVSYLEIYNEKIIDLLSKAGKDLKLKEDKNGNIVIGCKEELVNSVKDVLKIIRQGENNRHVGETMMNRSSNRSHCILRITIESYKNKEETNGKIRVSLLNLIDLAGSENAKKCKTKKTLNESRFINLSLSTLCSVIKQLSFNSVKKRYNDKKPFINYRDSKLTRILQSSLGGNSKTIIICTVTPAAFEETQSTLIFARRAKSIKNQPIVNETISQEILCNRMSQQILINKQLQEEIDCLKSKLEDKNKDTTGIRTKLSMTLKRRNTLTGSETVQDLTGNFEDKDLDWDDGGGARNCQDVDDNFQLVKKVSMNFNSSFKLEFPNFEKELDAIEKEKLEQVGVVALCSPRDSSARISLDGSDYPEYMEICQSGAQDDDQNITRNNYLEVELTQAKKLLEEQREGYQNLKEKYEKLESELLEERKKTKEKYEKLELKYLEERKKMKKINENLTNKNHELVEMVNPFMMSVEELQAQLASCTCGKKDGGAAGNTYPVQNHVVMKLDPMKKTRKRLSCPSTLSPIKDVSESDDILES